MKAILLAVMLITSSLIFTSCVNDAKEEVRDAITRVTVPVVAKYGSCENQAAIKADFEKKLNEWLKLQENQGDGVTTASVICELAVTSIIPPLVGLGSGQMPEAWNCSLATLQTEISSLAKEACGKLRK